MLDGFLEIENDLLRQMIQALQYRAWEFIVPMAGALVGSFLGIIVFYIVRFAWDLTHRKRVKLERRLDDARKMVLEAKAELAGQLKDNERLRRIITKYEKRWQQNKAEGRAIIDLAKRGAK